MKQVLVFLLLMLAIGFASIYKSHAQKMTPDVKPFKIAIPPEAVQDLKSRLAATRWPDEVAGAGWDYGTSLPYMMELAAYWQNQYDWPAQEAKLNALHHYTVDIDGQTIHFIHEKGKGKTNTPIVLMHGWPSSFVQMLKLIPLLTAADEKGHAFDVVVPSLIGYGFSSKPKEKGMNAYQMAVLFQKLMTGKLGYGKFILRGGDLGAVTAREWAMTYPQSVRGVHLSGSNPNIPVPPKDLTKAEQEFLEKTKKKIEGGASYAMQHSTKPTTLAYGLNDSPAGLAAWIMEKFQAWSDNKGLPESRFDRDDLLTNLSIYWFTQTIPSSIRLYYEIGHNPSPNMKNKVTVPTGFLMLDKDISGPREWEARTYPNIVHWKESPEGGHFGEWEMPDLMAKDIQAFARELK